MAVPQARRKVSTHVAWTPPALDPLRTDRQTQWQVFYEVLEASAIRNVEDVAGARRALAEADPRWTDEASAWRLSRELASYAYDRKREREPLGGRERAISAITYYTALQLQEQLRRARLHRSAA